MKRGGNSFLKGLCGDEERGEQLFKGTVDVILTDIPFEEGYVRFTKIHLKLMFEKKL